MASDIGYKSAFENFAGPGAVVLVPAKTVPLIVHAMVATVDTACELTFGHKDPPAGFGTAVPVTCAFHVVPGVPLLLPFTEDGWFGFPKDRDVVAAAIGGGAVNVGIQVVYARAGVE